MATMPASKARAALYGLLDEVSRSHAPVHITGKRSGAFLVGEEDWEAVMETLYLLSIPGMRGSIRRGLKVPLARCTKGLKW